VSCQEHQVRGRWQGYVGVVPSVYRGLAFTIAAAQIFLFPVTYYSVIPAFILVIAVGIYTLVKTLYPLRWYAGDILSHTVLGADIVICVFLVMATGGLHSPFLAYSLAPVLTTALVADRKLTLGIAALSVAGVIASHLANPLPPPPPLELGVFFLYAIAVFLTALLPYLINANLRQHLQFQEMLREGRRLSREIHDGTAQIMTGICWQVQLLRRRLTQLGMDLDEFRQLEALAEKAHRDIRESLELLRTYTGNGTLLPHLRDYLEHLNQDGDIDFHVDVETGEFHLEASVELELLRICQEALVNVRKHAQAHHVEVKVKPVSNHLKVSIADDGCGFDAVAYYHDGVEAKGHGLAVMQERVESIGGRFRVLSIPGKGTEVQVEVPANPGRRRLLWWNR